MSTNRKLALITGMSGGFFLVLGIGLALLWLDVQGPLLVADNPDQELRQPFADRGKVTVRFKIRNAGNSALQINSVATSCGCAVASFPQNELAPGSESTIEIRAFTPLVGKKTLYALVKSNCRQNPRTELTITGFSERMAPIFYGSPSWIYFSEIKRDGESQTAWIKTVERAGSSPWIERLQCDLPFTSVSEVAVKSVPFSAGYVERHYSFRVTVPTAPEPGEYRGRITIPNSDAVAVPVICHVPERLASMPPALYASLNAGAATSLEFRIRARSNEVPRFTNVTTNLANHIVVETSSPEDGIPVYQVHIIRPPEQGVLGGEIILTDSRAENLVRVPVMLTRAEHAAPLQN